ncbi:MAG: hypothetical protein AB8D52_03085 [Gammaproteobacteria bacterium]
MKLLIALLSFISLQVIAANGTETSYRYPSDLSEKETSTMISYRDTYDACLQKEAKANVDKYEDFRKVADVAMESCKKTLSEIDNGLAEMKLDPDFRRYFLRKSSQKSSQQLLNDLMQMKSK